MLNNLSSQYSINIALGAFYGVGYVEAMRLAQENPQPLIGNLSLKHAQLCPQNSGLIDESMIRILHDQFEHTQFRLHANAGVQTKRMVSDLANYNDDKAYWAQLAKVSQLLGAPAYSAHAGRRKYASIEEVLRYARDAETLFGCPVAVEGHYPAPGNPYLISTWKEYQQLFESKVNFALDLSHLNIVAARFRRYETNLVREMLSSDQCIEVHISNNNGQHDSHQSFTENPIWIDDLKYINSKAVIFSECQSSSRRII